MVDFLEVGAHKSLDYPGFSGNNWRKPKRNHFIETNRTGLDESVSGFLKVFDHIRLQLLQSIYALTVCV